MDASASTLFVALLLGYLLASIPFGLLLTRLFGTEDIRAIGSGNIGATNVLRTGRKGLAAATLILDMLKGTAAVLLALNFLGFNAALAAGLGAFLGHVFPVWLKFRGGKGVATYIGVLLAWNWIVGLVFCAVWLLIAVTRRYSSLSALTAAAVIPVVAFGLSGFAGTSPTGEQAAFAFAAACALMSFVVYFKHWPNIRRLMDGTEPKIGSEKKAG
jgi:glycerol-3-phosphate acyltransferase PlsY